MSQEIRITYWDEQLDIEAYSFYGIMQKFPNHFHEHYVIGFVEQGKRLLTCKNKHYTVLPKSLVVFNPYDNHACEQADKQKLVYHCFNISKHSMQNLLQVEDSKLPYFQQTVVIDENLVELFVKTHVLIKEKKLNTNYQTLYLLLTKLNTLYATNQIKHLTKPISQPIQTACSFLQQHYNKCITLDELSTIAGFSKYHFLRSFTKQTGITPDNYLKTLRINQAQKLLNKGLTLTNVALQTGFVDHSHFSNVFKKFIGITPKQYVQSLCKID